tara:strand:- start:147 stop:791 length:645 start_codon:yes stop_codon:yes gene_type:complete
MTKYLIISLLLIILCSLFITIKETKKFRKKNKELISFLLTVIATFLGVFLAIYYNDIAVEHQNEKTTIKILKAAYEELDLIQVETEVRIEQINNVKKNIGQEVLKHKFPFPTILPKSIQNNLVLENMSGTSLRGLNHGWRNLIVFNNILSDPQSVMFRTDESLRALTKLYNANLQFCKQLILNECELIENRIDLEEIEEKINNEYEVLNAVNKD